MWIFTTFGFFSIVQKTGEPDLTVRSRIAADLDQLRSRYMPALLPTISTPRADYPYRAIITHTDFAAGMAAIASDIHYNNFKNAVEGSIRRHNLYERVWALMIGLGHLVADRRSESFDGTP